MERFIGVLFVTPLLTVMPDIGKDSETEKKAIKDRVAQCCIALSSCASMLDAFDTELQSAVFSQKLAAKLEKKSQTMFSKLLPTSKQYQKLKASLKSFQLNSHMLGLHRHSLLKRG